MRTRDRIMVTLVAAVAALVVGVVASAQNLDVKGQFVAEGLTNLPHYFLGNVGIGTTTPTNKLQVALNDAESANFGGWSFKQGWEGELQWNGNRVMSVQSGQTYARFNGDIHVSGAVRVAGGNTYLQDKPVIGGSATGAYIYGYDGIQLDNRSFYNSPITLSMNGSEKMRVGYDGNVGIGTTSPVFKLDVRGTGYFSTPAGTTQLTLGDATNGTTSSIATSNQTLILNPDGSNEKMRITAAGNVGIGTTGPNGRLSLGASSYASISKPALLVYDGGFTAQGGNGVFAGFTVDQPSSNGLSMLAHSGGFLAFGRYANSNDLAAATEFMRITNSGNVGIGTTTPLYTLHVNGTAAGTSWTNLSSRDYKQDIRDVGAAEHRQMLAKLMEVQLKRYRYKKAYGGDGTTRLGFVAEDLPNDVLSQDGKGVDVYELVAYLAGAMKAQQEQQEQMRARDAEQQRQMNQQQRQIDDLLARLQSCR